MSRLRVFNVRLPLLAASIAACAFLPASVRGENVFDSISQEVQHVFERCKPAIVRIEAEDEHGKLAGTGFFIDPSGTLYTSYSIGGGTHDIVVSKNGHHYPAKRILADSRSGIAILKIDAPSPFLRLGKSANLHVASPVLTIGFPMDLPLSPNFGMVAGFDIKYLGNYFVTRHIRANVPVQRGQGGAPLLDLDGEVVGILISSLDGGNACFALPVEAAEKVRRDFLRFGEVRPGWIGISFEEAAHPEQGSNVRVADLIPGSPGEHSGIKPGDILLQLGDTRIDTPQDVLNAAFYLTAGDEARLVVSRGGKKQTYSVTAAETPSPEKGTLQALGESTPKQKH